MPLRRGQAQRLREAGFLESEIRKISRARAPDGSLQQTDIDGIAWQKTLESRKRWVGQRLDEGWSKEEIRRRILRYYKRKAGRSPFDFLKLEYKPPQKLTDFQYALKLRARARVSRTFGRKYGRRR